MEAYQTWVEAPWREMPGWLRGFTLVVCIAGAEILDHAIGSVAGFVIGLVAAVIAAVLIPFAWHATQG